MDETYFLEKRNKIMEDNNMDTLYDKVIGVIKSAVNFPQLKTATKMYNVFLDKYK